MIQGASSHIALSSWAWCWPRNTTVSGVGTAGLVAPANGCNAWYAVAGLKGCVADHHLLSQALDSLLMAVLRSDHNATGSCTRLAGVSYSYHDGGV